MSDTLTFKQRLNLAIMDMPNPKLDSVNPHYKSRYASLASINNAVKPALKAQGLSYSQSQCVQMIEGYSLPIWWLVTTVTDGQETCEVGRVTTDTHGKAQDRGSELTYSRRYGLCTAFGLVGEEDDDGNQAQATQTPADHLQPLRDMMPAYAQALNLSLVDAASHLAAQLGVASLADLTQDNVAIAMQVIGEVVQ